eukprot:342034-Chlamydomonas_euryale.AAC.5
MSAVVRRPGPAVGVTSDSNKHGHSIIVLSTRRHKHSMPQLGKTCPLTPHASSYACARRARLQGHGGGRDRQRAAAQSQRVPDA